MPLPKNHEKHAAKAKDRDNDAPVEAVKASKKVKKGSKNTKAEEKGSKPAKVLPVTLLSGFLGAGKTTLLKHLLESNQHKLRLAVIVNDMAELNIDAALVKQAKLVQAKQEFISLQNGCICCTLRYDLIREIQRIQELGTFDYLIIESTGIAEPMHVAESFVVNPQTQQVIEEQDPSLMLHSLARLDTCVTVVDSSEFYQQLNSLQVFREAYASELATEDEGNAEGEKPISQLLIDQIEFANVILLNKSDLLPNPQMIETEIIPFVKTLNPTAKIFVTTHAQIDAKEIVNTNLFSMEEASNAAGWLQSIKSTTVHSEKDEYGIFSFVYRSRKPFHPGRLHSWLREQFLLDNPWERITQQTKSSLPSRSHGNKSINTDLSQLKQKYGSLLRSKGFCWLATRDTVMIEWNHHGRRLEMSPLMDWYCYQPESDWHLSEEEKMIVRKDFDGVFGDCRQEIVFIGVQLQIDAITAALNDCLLTDSEMEDFMNSVGTSNSRFLASDPLPTWPMTIDQAGIFSSVLREQEENILILPAGMELTINQIALNEISGSFHHEHYENISSVKLWLDTFTQGGRQRKVLVCTLRPGVVEQLATSISLFLEPSGEDEADAHDHDHNHSHHHDHDHDHQHENEEETSEELQVRFSLEIIDKKKRKYTSNLDTNQSTMLPYEVHIIGASRWIVETTTESEEEAEDGDEDDN